MTDRLTCDLTELPSGEGCFHISLHAPRANSLVPAFLTDLHHAFDHLEKSGASKSLITSGRNFSSGGDVAGFYGAAHQDRAEAYARDVVPQLQDLVLRMIEAPVLIASAVRGAATGGSAGLVFASDLVTAAPNAFVQPYYGIMGYAPDGGWTATLPELIGLGPARGWLIANRRQKAPDLLQMGLAQAVSDDPEAQALHLLSSVETGTALASKRLLWTAERVARVRTALRAETEAFVQLIGRPEVLARMNDFLNPTGTE